MTASPADVVFTLGYGGRRPAEFVGLLTDAGVRTVADVRLRPDRSSLGSFKFTGKPDTGIEKLLADAGIAYVSLPELGNLFLNYDDSLTRYAAMFALVGHQLTGRIVSLVPPICLVCAEKSVDRCHRKTIADYLGARGAVVRHIE